MTIGYDKPLYVLPFDHRATFSKNMFGWKGQLTAEQTAEITAVKQVIYDAFKAALTGGVPKEWAGRGTIALTEISEREPSKSWKETQKRKN
jgi:hypothetical protein